MQVVHPSSHHNPTLQLLQTRAKQAYFYQTEFIPDDNSFAIIKNKPLIKPAPPVRSSFASVPSTSAAFSSKATDVKRNTRNEREPKCSMNKESKVVDSGELNRKPSRSRALTQHNYNKQDSSEYQHQNRPRKPRRHSSCGGGLRNAKSESNLKNDSMKTDCRMSTNTINKTVSSVGLSDEDTYQIQLFYSAKGTQVIVCSCLCNLYYGKETRNNKNYGKKMMPTSDTWNLMATGVPVLLLDEGRSRSRPERRLQIVLAEKGTGYTLWSDVIDSLTSYSEVGSSFHTMLFSNDHQKVAGLRFDNAYAAARFMQHLRNLAAEPENVALSAAHHSKRDPKRIRRHSIIGNHNITDKMSISTPCCFRHVTSLKPHHIAALDPENSKLSSFKSPLGLSSSLSSRAQSCFTIASSNEDMVSQRSQGSPNTVV